MAFGTGRWTVGAIGIAAPVAAPTAAVETIAINIADTSPASIAYNGTDLIIYASPDSPFHGFGDADTGNRLRKVSLAGVSSAFASDGHWGVADGTGLAARFWPPVWLTRMPGTGDVYMSDTGVPALRKVTDTAVVTTLHSGAAVGQPGAIAVDASGNVYFVDTLAATLNKWAPGDTLSFVAGGGSGGGDPDGTGSAAQLGSALGSQMVMIGADLYLADYGTHRIRKITPSGVVTTVAGSGTAGHDDGVGAAATFEFPTRLTALRGKLYTMTGGALREVTLDGVVTTILGDPLHTGHVDGSPPDARLTVNSLTTDGEFIYACEDPGLSVRRITVP